MNSRGCWALLLCLHVSILSALVLSGPADVVMDAAGYWKLGLLCADGNFVWANDPIAYRTPGYPAFLGLMQAMADSRAWLMTIIVQHVLLVLTTVVTAWLVWRITQSEHWAMAAYTLAALGMVRAWFAQTLLTETLFIFVITLHMACLWACLNRTTVRLCAAVGATLGLSILIRPVVQLWWLPAFALIVTAGSSGSVRSRLRASAVGIMVMCVIVMPWFVRNRAVFGEYFLTQFVGRNLWIVTFQDGSGTGLKIPQTESGQQLLNITEWPINNSELRATWSVSDRLADTGMPDDDIDRLMKRVCVDAIRAAPVEFGKAAFRRLVNFWRCVPDPYPYIKDPNVPPPVGQLVWRQTTLTDLETAIYQMVPQRSLQWNMFVALLVLTGTVMMIVRPDTRWFGVSLLLFFGMISGLTALVEIPNVRYRLVLEPLLVVALCCGAGSRCAKVS